MPYAVELYFDIESAETIDNIRRKLDLHGINLDHGTKPHITLAIYQDLDEQVIKEALLNFSKEIKPFVCSLASVGLFVSESPVLFLAPVVTKDLLQIHDAFHKRLETYQSNAWDYYLPGNWVPHCTLAMDCELNLLSSAMEICKDAGLPIKARVERIGLLEFKPNKQLYELKIGE